MMLPLLALVLAPLSQTGSQTGPQTGSVHAPLHPADAQLYFELPDTAALGSATLQAPLAQLVQDDSIEALLAFAGDPDLTSVGAAIAKAWENSDIPAPLRQLLLNAAKDMRTYSVSIAGLRPDSARLERDLTALLQVEADLLAIDAALAARGEAGLPQTLAELEGAPTTDPWGNAYLYELREGRDPEVRSTGGDGADGGAFLAGDFTTWTNFSEERALAYASEFRMLSVLEFGEAATASALVEIALGAAADGPVTIEQESLGDAVVHRISLADPEEVQGWVLVDGPRIVIGLGATSPEAYATRTAEDSLASAASWNAAMGPLGAAGEPAILVMQGNLTYRELRGLQALARFEVDGDGRADDFEVAVADLIAPLDGPYETWALRAAPAEKGFDWRSFSTAKPYGGEAPSDVTQAGAAARVPGDATFAWAAPLDLEPFLMLAEFLPGEVTAPLEEWLTGAEGDGEVSFARDIVANVGPRFLAFAPPPSGPTVPKIQLWIELRDPERFAAAWTQLISNLPELEEGFSLRTKAYKGIDYTQLRTPTSMLAPSFAVIDGRLLVTLDSRTFKGVAKAMAKGELGATEATHPVLAARAAGLDGAQSWVMIDWGRMLGGYYGTALALAGLAGDALPVPVDQLPPADIFESYLRATLSVASVRDGGLLTVRESSFGPLGWATPLVLGVGGAVVVPRAMQEMGGGMVAVPR